MGNHEAAQLYQRVMQGDESASRELIQLQRNGRALRYYPNGRKGPDDDGVVGFSIDVCMFEGSPHLRISSGVKTRTAAIPRDIAIRLVRKIEGLPVPLLMDDCDVAVGFHDGKVILIMPSEDIEWFLTIPQALGLTSRIADVLMEQTRGQGLGAINDLMDALEIDED